MEDNAPKIFSLTEANEIVEEIAEFTAEIVNLLESVRARYQKNSESSEIEIPDNVVKDVENALRTWNEKVAETGARPKGFFTVDFQTADPELLYCWTFGEKQISFIHKIWENFTHRRPLSDAGGAVDHMKWVN